MKEITKQKNPYSKKNKIKYNNNIQKKNMYEPIHIFYMKMQLHSKKRTIEIENANYRIN